MNAVPPPSGLQYTISSGTQRATVVEVGAGIRTYSVDERDVLDPYPAEMIADGAHGTPLVPWPNRLQDGRYRFEDTEYQLPLTEPERGNAIHGLLRWRPWRAAEVSAHRVVMATRLHPMPGYPFTLDVRIEYRLGTSGLEVTTTATNAGDRPCPYGCGQHPYLSPGTGLVDECTLQFEAGARITTDDRGLSTGRADVAGTEFDFREGAKLGALRVDSAFTDLGRDDDQRALARLTGPDGRTAVLWVDRHHPYIEIFTGDTLAPDRRRRGLGCEPMTCPPNAFATGTDVVHLQPGESMITQWGAMLL